MDLFTRGSDDSPSAPHVHITAVLVSHEYQRGVRTAAELVAVNREPALHGVAGAMAPVVVFQFGFCRLVLEQACDGELHVAIEHDGP